MYSIGQTHVASTAPAKHPDVKATTGFELFCGMSAGYLRNMSSTQNEPSAKHAAERQRESDGVSVARRKSRCGQSLCEGAHPKPVRHTYTLTYREGPVLSGMCDDGVRRKTYLVGRQQLSLFSWSTLYLSGLTD